MLNYQKVFHTHMLHLWNIYLHLGDSKVQCLCIFPGAYGIPVPSMSGFTHPVAQKTVQSFSPAPQKGRRAEEEREGLGDSWLVELEEEVL